MERCLHYLDESYYHTICKISSKLIPVTHSFTHSCNSLLTWIQIWIQIWHLSFNTVLQFILFIYQYKMYATFKITKYIYIPGLKSTSVITISQNLVVIIVIITHSLVEILFTLKLDIWSSKAMAVSDVVFTCVLTE